MAKKKKTKEEKQIEKSGIDMSKVTLKELKGVVESLNESDLLDAKIKVGKRTVGSLALSFCDAIEELDDAGKLDDIPEDAFEYYGKIVPGDEEEEEEADVDDEEEEEEIDDDDADEEDEDDEEEEAEEEEPAPAKKKKKTGKAKKETKKKAKKPAGPGVIQTILDYITAKGPVTKKQILAHLVRKFPDREQEAMKKTVNVQLGGQKRPSRMEREKDVTFDIDDKGKFSIATKKKAKAKSKKKKKK